MKKSPFTDTVYALCRYIPRGKVATYGQIAKLAGNPGAARAVGMLMKHNPDNKLIPCHRIVASDGKLTGYAFGSGVTTKKELLQDEGVSFIKDRVNLSLSQWMLD